MVGLAVESDCLVTLPEALLPSVECGRDVTGPGASLEGRGAFPACLQESLSPSLLHSEPFLDK